MGFVVSIKGEPSHDIILKGVHSLINLTHRGACGCDPETGDGAWNSHPDPSISLLAVECANLGFHPASGLGEYGVGMVFLPIERQVFACSAKGCFERIARRRRTPSVLGWRDTPHSTGARNRARVGL